MDCLRIEAKGLIRSQGQGWTSRKNEVCTRSQRFHAVYRRSRRTTYQQYAGGGHLSICKDDLDGPYARGLAPKTWGNASRKDHNKYEREMETWWPVLRYCSNHWKTHHIATKNYSQWYGHRETNKTEAKAPAKKKCRTTIGDDNTGNYQTDPDLETDAVPSEAADEDSNIALPSWKGAHKGPVAGPLRPKARPLRDPL